MIALLPDEGICFHSSHYFPQARLSTVCHFPQFVKRGPFVEKISQHLCPYLPVRALELPLARLRPDADLSRRQEHRPIVHQRIVPVPAPSLRQAAPGQFPKLLVTCAFAELEAMDEDSPDIGVDRDGILICGENPDRGSSIWADARQSLMTVEGSQHIPLVFLRDDPCGLVEIFRPVVVAEPEPFPEDIRAVGLRKLMDGRPFPQPPTIISDNPVHLRLLQHNLGEEDGIRVCRVAPGQVPSLPCIEAKNILTERPYPLGWDIEHAVLPGERGVMNRFLDPGLHMLPPLPSHPPLPAHSSRIPSGHPRSQRSPASAQAPHPARSCG